MIEDLGMLIRIKCKNPEEFEKIVEQLKDVSTDDAFIVFHFEENIICIEAYDVLQLKLEILGDKRALKYWDYEVVFNKADEIEMGIGDISVETMKETFQVELN